MKDDETDVAFYQRADNDASATLKKCFQSYGYSTVSILDYFNEGCREDDR